MDKKKLAYKLVGQKIDLNAITPTNTNILWRSSKDIGEIEKILHLIKQKIQELAQNLDIQSDSICLFNPTLRHKCLQPHNHILTSKHYYTPQASRIVSSSITDCRKILGYLHSHKHKILMKHLHNRKTNFMKQEILMKQIKHGYTLKKRYLTCLRQTKNMSYCQNLLPDIPKKSQIYVNMNAFLCPNKNWIEEYKQSIMPTICGGFYIRPSWHKVSAEYPNIIVDPSLSFGSGHHATTAMCIEFLSTLNIRNKDFLDVGCGSGILSLVSAKLGAKIYCCDTDIEACMQSKKNFTSNGLHAQYVWHGSITDIPKHNNIPKEYDCICANLVSSIIIILKNHLIQSLKTNGILILSGILSEQEQRIVEAFSHLKLLEKKQIDEWIGLKFMKK